jgi:hypothetical protein
MPINETQITMIKPTIEELKKYKAYYKSDTIFASNARLLQSKWRDGNGYQSRTYGNYLELEFAKRTKANFLTDNIKRCVSEAIIDARNNGGMIGEPRIWNNLLSSQPLCFNLFGEMSCDPDLATGFFNSIFPKRVKRVEKIKFEHSEHRGDSNYTGDHSAFDVFVEYFNHQSEKCFIGIEVKYAESLREETRKKAEDNFKRHQYQYERLTTQSKAFKDGSIDYLKQVPIAQIWRDHLLSIATKKDYSDGFFIFLFPSQNEKCQKGVDLYKSHLISTDEEITGFYTRHLETFIQALEEVCDATWVSELRVRYLGELSNTNVDLLK